MAKNATKRFIILIGGPGLFKSCDKDHDQTWTNYIVPLQLAAKRGLYQKADNEKIYWLVYEPPYRNRWQDDSIITKQEQKEDDGAHLHTIRKSAAEKVKKYGATNYLHRIKQIAAQHKIVYKGINRPDDFWAFIGNCPKASITRVWYCGHAGEKGLMLALIHEINDQMCEAAAYKKEMIELVRLAEHKAKADRFDSKTTKFSRFYGCKTNMFAKKWRDIFKVPTQGAENKVNFGCIDQPSNYRNILKRIEETPTKDGSPNWRTFR